MAAAPFFFQILLADRKNEQADAVNRSIVVEVSPEMVFRAGLAGQKEKPERDCAVEIALRVATEIIHGESPSGSIPADSIAQIGSLPDEIVKQTPALQRAGLRAWFL